MPKEKFDQTTTSLGAQNESDGDSRIPQARKHAEELAAHRRGQSPLFRVVAAAATDSVEIDNIGPRSSRQSPAGRKRIIERIHQIQSEMRGEPSHTDGLREKLIAAADFWKRSGRMDKPTGNKRIFPNNREASPNAMTLLEQNATRIIEFPPQVGAAYMIKEGTQGIDLKLASTLHSAPPGVFVKETPFTGWNAVSLPTSLEPIILPEIPKELQQVVVSLHKIHCGLRALLEKVQGTSSESIHQPSALFPIRFDMVLDPKGKFWVVDANPTAMGLSIHATRADTVAQILSSSDEDQLEGVNFKAAVASLPKAFRDKPCIFLDRGANWMQPEKSRFIFRDFEVQKLRATGLDIILVDMAEIQQGQVTVIPGGIRLSNGEIVTNCIIGKDWRKMADEDVRRFGVALEKNKNVGIINDPNTVSLFGNRLWLILLQFKEVQEHLINNKIVTTQELEAVVNHLPKSAMVGGLKRNESNPTLEFAGDLVTGIDIESGALHSRAVAIPNNHSLSNALIGIGGRGLVAKTLDGSGASGIQALSSKGHNTHQLKEFLGRTIVFEELIPSAVFQVKQPFHPFPIEQGPGRFEVFATFPEEIEQPAEVISLAVVVNTGKKETIVHPAGAETTFIPILIEKQRT